mgnify:CR=1 FL=1
MIYTVTLNPALDYVVHLDRLTVGTVNRSSGENLYFGGKGINVSTILHTLGVDTTALGFVAGFTGSAIEEGVRRQGIPTDFVRLEDGLSRINVKIKTGQETEINGHGPVIPSDAIEQLFTRLDRLNEGDTLVLAGSIPGSLPPDIYEQILRRLSGRGVSSAVDTTGALLLSVLPYHPFLIKPNRQELGELFSGEASDDTAVAEQARELQRRGARNVLVSMAGDGSLLLTEEGHILRMGTPNGRVRNSVGAGDSMVAGFLAGYTRSHDYQTALKWGTAAGSATAFSDGLASAADIQKIYQTIL